MSTRVILFSIHYTPFTTIITVLFTLLTKLPLTIQISVKLCSITFRVKVGPPQISCIKDLLRSIFFRYLLTQQRLKPKRKLGVSVHLIEQW